mmetsp:Transcript_5161/g.18266  ORF Transcript_5161/g.18266 Transcript_5161/m.18266 type:complete len:265 (+) Transcript_5161:1618-2412(+)
MLMARHLLLGREQDKDLDPYRGDKGRSMVVVGGRRRREGLDGVRKLARNWIKVGGRRHARGGHGGFRMLTQNWDENDRRLIRKGQGVIREYGHSEIWNEVRRRDHREHDEVNDGQGGVRGRARNENGGVVRRRARRGHDGVRGHARSKMKNGVRGHARRSIANGVRGHTREKGKGQCGSGQHALRLWTSWGLRSSVHMPGRGLSTLTSTELLKKNSRDRGSLCGAGCTVPSRHSATGAPLWGRASRGGGCGSHNINDLIADNEW